MSCIDTTCLDHLSSHVYLQVIAYIPTVSYGNYYVFLFVCNKTKCEQLFFHISKFIFHYNRRAFVQPNLILDHFLDIAYIDLKNIRAIM